MYFIKNVNCHNLLDGHHSLDRIRAGGGWTFIDGNYQDNSGCWVLNKRVGERFVDYAIEGESCEDGLIWFKPLNQVNLEALAKPIKNNMIGIDIVTSGGICVNIPNALTGSNQFKLGKKKLEQKIGNPISDYGKLALELYSILNSKDENGKDNELNYEDIRISRLITLALQCNFYVTEELIDHMAFIGINDVHSIIMASWGLETDVKKN
jgi:hypothetical protein